MLADIAKAVDSVTDGIKNGGTVPAENIIRFSKLVKTKLMKELENMDILGREAEVIVDRMMGTYHPQHPNIYYPINYGYIEGIIAPDGEEQDAYIIGVDKPVSSFKGVVIAIIHRYDDIEEKWVVAPRGASFTKEEVKAQVEFQERYFQSEIIM